MCQNYHNIATNVSTVSPRQFRHLADRLFQTVAEVCRKDRSAKQNGPDLVASLADIINMLIERQVLV